MKVLQVSTPFLPVSSEMGYGGTERMVYLLDKELSKRNISLGVVAPQDSKPESRLFPTIQNSIGVSGILDESSNEGPEGFYLRLDHIMQSINYANKLSEIDVVHMHDDNMFAFGDFIKHPSILTLHTFYELFWDTSKHLFAKDSKTKLVAISNSQKKIYESHGCRIDFVVYHGIDEEKLCLSEKKYPYLLSLGCIHPLKRQEDVIEVGKKTGIDVVLAGNIGSIKYFQEKILPFIDIDLSSEDNKLNAYLSLPSSSNNKVVYVGTVNDEQKKPLYSHAKAFLMPLGLEEPFGLVMVEAMMSGTPVIAYKKGSVPELVVPGKTGFIVNNLEEMVEAVKDIETINSADCRKNAINSFSSKRMAEDYIKVYQEIINNKN